MNKHMEIPFGPSVGRCPSCTPCALLPGSKMEKTIIEMKVPINCGIVVKRFRVPKYIPDVVSSADVSTLGPTSVMLFDTRRLFISLGLLDCPRRLISIPIYVKGAQDAKAHGLRVLAQDRLGSCTGDETHNPHIATRVDAIRNDVTNGASAIAQTKMK